MANWCTLEVKALSCFEIKNLSLSLRLVMDWVACCCSHVSISPSICLCWTESFHLLWILMMFQYNVSEEINFFVVDRKTKQHKRRLKFNPFFPLKNFYFIPSYKFNAILSYVFWMLSTFFNVPCLWNTFLNYLLWYVLVVHENCMHEEESSEMIFFIFRLSFSSILHHHRGEHAYIMTVNLSCLHAMCMFRIYSWIVSVAGIGSGCHGLVELYSTKFKLLQSGNFKLKWNRTSDLI